MLSCLLINIARDLREHQILFNYVLRFFQEEFTLDFAALFKTLLSLKFHKIIYWIFVISQMLEEYSFLFAGMFFCTSSNSVVVSEPVVIVLLIVILGG